MSRVDHSRSPDHAPDFWQPNRGTLAAERHDRAQRDLPNNPRNHMSNGDFVAELAIGLAYVAVLLAFILIIGHVQLF